MANMTLGEGYSVEVVAPEQTIISMSPPASTVTLVVPLLGPPGADGVSAELEVDPALIFVNALTKGTS